MAGTSRYFFLVEFETEGDLGMRIREMEISNKKMIFSKSQVGEYTFSAAGRQEKNPWADQSVL